MQQHSAQHLISALFIQHFALPTLSWWLASFPTESFIELDSADLSLQQLQQVERETNTIIRRALPMHMHTFPTVDAALADDNFTSRLPAHKVLGDHLKGTVRVIEIEGVDMNPCGGTHLSRTSELQLIHLTRFDKSKGHVRVFFLAGDRALHSLTTALAIQREVGALLSTPGDGQAEMVRKMQTELKGLIKATKSLSSSLAEKLAKELHQSTGQVLHYHQVEGSLAFLQSICEAFAVMEGGGREEGAVSDGE